MNLSDNQQREIETAYRRLGTRTGQCPHCGERDPRALTGTHSDIRCYEHDCLARGRSPVEAHHPAKWRNDRFTIDIPGNDHRILSSRQQQWPIQTLRNPDGSPLLKLSAALRGFLDILHQIIDRLLSWAIHFLEELDAHLCHVLGNRWWEQFDWETTWP
jgi:hypothetical protein